MILISAFFSGRENRANGDPRWNSYQLDKKEWNTKCLELDAEYTHDSIKMAKCEQSPVQSVELLLNNIAYAMQKRYPRLSYDVIKSCWDQERADYIYTWNREIKPNPVLSGPAGDKAEFFFSRKQRFVEEALKVILNSTTSPVMICDLEVHIAVPTKSQNQEREWYPVEDVSSSNPRSKSPPKRPTPEQCNEPGSHYRYMHLFLLRNGTMGNVWQQQDANNTRILCSWSGAFIDELSFKDTDEHGNVRYQLKDGTDFVVNPWTGFQVVHAAKHQRGREQHHPHGGSRPQRCPEWRSGLPHAAAPKAPSGTCTPPWFGTIKPDGTAQAPIFLD